MSIQQAAQAAVQVFPNQPVTLPDGTTTSLPVLMVAIAGHESGWNPTEPGDFLGTCPGCTGPASSDGATSWGLWQIHNIHSAYLEQVTGSSDPNVWEQWLFDPVHNAEAAWALWQGAVHAGEPGWQPWSVDITTGAYRRYLAQAQQAVAAIQAAPPSPSPPSPAPPPTVSGLQLTLPPVTVGFAVALAALGGLALVVLAVPAWRTEAEAEAARVGRWAQREARQVEAALLR